MFLKKSSKHFTEKLRLKSLVMNSLVLFIFLDHDALRLTLPLVHFFKLLPISLISTSILSDNSTF